MPRDPQNPGAPYRVSWGYYHDNSRQFDTFAEALAFYREKDTGPSGASLHGDGYDADCDGDGFFECSDGLTEDERDQRDGLDAPDEPDPIPQIAVGFEEDF
jgi:hypothetical protein